MHESLMVLQAAIPVYLVVLLGGLLRRCGVLRPKMDRVLMLLAVYVFYPCLILDKMLVAEVLRDPVVLWSSAGAGFGFIVIGALLSYLLAPLIGLKIGSGRRTFAVSAGLQNYGFIAIPLVAYLYPGNDDVMAILFTHNLGVEFAVWTVLLMLLSGMARPSWRVFLKGPILAVIAGIVMMQTGSEKYVPGTILDLFSKVGVCAVPLSLLLVGTAMYDLIGKMKFDWKLGAGAVLARLALIPVLMLVCAKYLPLSIELKQVLVIQAALPSGMFPIVLSRHYGGRTDIAITAVVATTIASLLTMPLVIAFGKFWVGV
ncbi:MAG: AEC family transporter [Akkermansiaceae bacterium]|nr:AEC family transporter [Akkermansiaceae bacterium]